MELKDTVSLMTSSNYRDRFLCEYQQTKIRYDKLMNMYQNWDNLDFTPTCDKEIYKLQLTSMNDYLSVLTQRAKAEGIDLYV